jgi:hypothetical protein
MMGRSAWYEGVEVELQNGWHFVDCIAGHIDMLVERGLSGLK